MREINTINVFEVINQYAEYLGKSYQDAQFDVDKDIIRYKMEAVLDLHKLFNIAFFNELDEYDEWLQSA